MSIATVALVMEVVVEIVSVKVVLGPDSTRFESGIGLVAE